VTTSLAPSATALVAADRASPNTGTVFANPLTAFAAPSKITVNAENYEIA
jgi:hypothetical protein